MEPWLQRVVAEHAELTERLDALSSFLESPAIVAISGQQQVLLQAQRTAVSLYQEILERRIDAA